MKKIISFMLLCSTLSLISCSNKADDNDDKGTEKLNNNNENTNNDIEVNDGDDLTLRVKGSNAIAKSIELDCGIERTSYNHDSSLKGETFAAFPSSIEIDASIPTKFKGKVKIEWTIPEVDNSYFSLDTYTGNTVKVTATSPSRLSTLTAKMINTSDNSVIKETTCELRSVMINTYWIGEQDKTDNKISGCDITGYSSGYSARFYNTSYGDNLDIVFPSKLAVKINDQNVTKNLCRIVGLATSGGEGGINKFNIASCRYLYIPNTVYLISGSALCFTKPSKTFFQSGGVNYTFFDSNSLVNDSDGNSRFVGSINFEDGTFPYVSYAIVESETLSDKPTFASVTYSIIFNQSRANKMLLSKGE